ncbi:MAG: ABC transporter permease, partial [Acidobacteriota bacterium]
MRSILTDVKYAMRSLRLAPGFTVVALAVLTLGIGATTAIYSIVDAVVLRRLPYAEEGRLIRIGEPSRTWAAKGIAVSPQAFFDWRAQQGGVFEAIGAQGGSKFRAADPDFRTVRVLGVTAGFISALRIAPAIGHSFSEENENEGNHRVALINDTLWRRRFNADPSVLGKTVAGSDGPWEIVGVLPPGTGYPSVQDDIEFMWTPFVPEASQRLRTANGRSY